MLSLIVDSEQMTLIPLATSSELATHQSAVAGAGSLIALHLRGASKLKNVPKRGKVQMGRKISAGNQNVHRILIRGGRARFSGFPQM